MSAKRTKRGRDGDKRGGPEQTGRRAVRKSPEGGAERMVGADVMALSLEGRDANKRERRRDVIQEKTIARRFVGAFGGRDMAALDEVLAEDVVFYGTLAWGQKGREALKASADELHEGSPGLRVALQDEFYSADGDRGSMRVALHFHNTGRFFGKEPSGKRGVSVGTFTKRIRDGKIVELVQGGNTLTLGYVEVVDLGLPFPTDTPDPQPEIVSASAG